MLIAIICYLMILVLMFVFQRHLQYFPDKKIVKISNYELPDFREIFLTTADNKKILVWYKAPPKNGKLIIYFHGNAGNLSNRAEKFKIFAQNGFGILAVSYRGYGGSEGQPSEVGLLDDGATTIKFALSQNYSDEDLIFFGESLGSGIATQMAVKFNPYAVILESPFSSVLSVGQHRYWFVPVRFLLKDKFESIKFAPKILAPVLIFHGTADSVVPYFEGKKLFEAINSQKKLITVAGAGHVDFSADFQVKEMKKFFSEMKNKLE